MKKQKKLSIKKVTLLDLDDLSLQAMAGGVVNTATTCACKTVTCHCGNSDGCNTYATECGSTCLNTCQACVTGGGCNPK